MTLNSDAIEDTILRRICSAISANRHPGLHFPGFFLGLHATRLEQDGVTLGIEYGPHCTDSRGNVNVCALALLADTAMAAALRLNMPEGTRLATTSMHLQFTGRPPNSAPICETLLEGIYQGINGTQGHVVGKVKCGDQVIANTSGTFAAPSAHHGAAALPVPWKYMQSAYGLAPMGIKDMTDEEKRIVMAARSALKSASADDGFIASFWPQLATARVGGSALTLRLRPHLENRYGNGLGGIMVGIAAAAAVGAVPGQSRLTGISAWFISAGTGRLRVRSRVIQLGKTIAVIRTEAIGENKRPVLEVITSHMF